MESKNKKTIKDLQAQVTKAQADLGRCRNPPPIRMSSTNCKCMKLDEKKAD